VLVTPPGFNAWLATPEFRDAVLGLFAERMADLTSLIDAIAFHQLDRRLAAALLGHGKALHTTHQALADELDALDRLRYASTGPVPPLADWWRRFSGLVRKADPSR
jgi:hypothetical protein